MSKKMIFIVELLCLSMPCAASTVAWGSPGSESPEVTWTNLLDPAAELRQEKAAW